MVLYRHPLLTSEYANVPAEQRVKLGCCCLNGCNKKLDGRRPSDAWQRVEEHVAEGSSSSSSRYTAGKKDLGTDPLNVTFSEPASRQSGDAGDTEQWAEPEHAAEFVLHIDGEGDGPLEELQPAAAQASAALQQLESTLQQQEDEERLAKRHRADDMGLEIWESLLAHMAAVRDKGPVMVEQQVEEAASQSNLKQYIAAAAAADKAVEGKELTDQELVQETEQRIKRFFTTTADYLRTHGSPMLSTLPNLYKIASYWDAEGGGFIAFQMDCHMSSEATGRPCPAGCPHCRDQVPKWGREQHRANTTESLAFFDRTDHHDALTAALKQGQLLQVADEDYSISGFSLHPVLDKWYNEYLFGSVHSMETERNINKARQARGPHTSQMTQQRQFLRLSKIEVQLDVTADTYKEWKAGAAEQAAARRQATPAENGHVRMLHQALAKATASGKRVRGSSEAEERASRAAQRRAQDPAAVRVRLVNSMRYLPLKRAALLGLMQLPVPSPGQQQQQQQQEQQQQQQQQGGQQEQEARELEQQVAKLSVTQVKAQLLDERWSTEQLQVASDMARSAAAQLSKKKKEAKAARSQNIKEQQQQPQLQRAAPSSRSHLVRNCTLVKPAKNMANALDSDEDSDSSISNAESSDADSDSS